MIQIDDAGSGSFVGGTCIGFFRPETLEYYFDIIPVELYNEINFSKKLYLDKVVSISSKAFIFLKVSKKEPIEICQGYMFERLKSWLDLNEFNWHSTHITGTVQDIVETNYSLYTVKLGLPIYYIKYTKFPFHFHKLLRWVFADYDNRIRNCKVGWKCWNKISNIKPVLSKTIVNSSNMVCLKCGKPIKKGSIVNIIRFFSNRENYVYIHRKC